MQDKRIVIASDHGGFEMKRVLVEKMASEGYEVIDKGVFSSESVDYPDMAKVLALAIQNAEAEKGVLLCGTGIGMSIAVNRYPFIRGALVHDSYTARLARQHNDANVLVLGGRSTGVEVAKECLDIFLTTAFEGGRHERRVEKLQKML